MKPRKKNKFFTFVFSFCPGAAEMYMGFMKSGLSLLVCFAIPIIIEYILYGGDYLIILSAIVYVFSFFHARHIATAPQEQFDMLEDRCIWEEFMNGRFAVVSSKAYKKWIAVALILVGINGLWYSFRHMIGNSLEYFMTEYERMLAERVIANVPRLAFSVLVIVIGVLLIRGKKKELIGDDKDGSDSRAEE